jgi:hypothetical protein
LAVAACHRRSHDDGAPRFEETCAISCDRVHECDSEVDAEECRQNCHDAFSPFGAHLRKEFLEEVDQCLEDARCGDLGVSALDNSCRRDASDRIGANLKVVELCKAINATLVHCGSNGQELEVCASSMKIFDDETLDKAKSCADVPCGDLGRCFTMSAGVIVGMPVDARGPARD